MKALILLATCIVAASAVPPSQARSDAGIFGCTKDVTIEGHHAIKFCGRAEASVQVGAHTGTIRGGSCVHAAGRFAVNVGISAYAVKPAPDWLSLTTLSSPHTGIQPVSVTLFLHGKGYAIVQGTITIAAGEHHGSFGGLTGATVFQNNVKVSGTFTC